MLVHHMNPHQELELAKEVLEFLEEKFEKNRVLIRKTAVLELALKSAEAYEGECIVKPAQADQQPSA